MPRWIVPKRHLTVWETWQACETESSGRSVNKNIWYFRNFSQFFLDTTCLDSWCGHSSKITRQIIKKFKSDCESRYLKSLPPIKMILLWLLNSWFGTLRSKRWRWRWKKKWNKVCHKMVRQLLLKLQTGMAKPTPICDKHLLKAVRVFL